jgi:DUF971 family protein
MPHTLNASVALKMQRTMLLVKDINMNSASNIDTVTAPWPTKLSVDATRQVLSIAFDNGSVFAIEAELLRVNSPSAEVQGHSPDQKVTVWGKRLVTITRLIPVGNYAIRIAFDDGHDTGIFTWAYLRELGLTREAVWAAYEAELIEKKLHR